MDGVNLRVISFRDIDVEQNVTKMMRSNATLTKFHDIFFIETFIGKNEQ